MGTAGCSVAAGDAGKGGVAPGAVGSVLSIWLEMARYSRNGKRASSGAERTDAQRAALLVALPLAALIQKMTGDRGDDA